MVQFAPTLSGTLEGVSLADMLQVFHYGKKSVTVHVGGQPSGRVFMVEGELYHAQCESDAGEPALARLISQTQVRLRTTPLDTAPEHSITRSFSAVVLDILRIRDERIRDTGEFPIVAAPEDATEEGSETLRTQLEDWLRRHQGIEHAALIEPVQHKVLACDSKPLWSSLVQTALLQSLCAPYFDDAFAEIDATLGSLPPHGRDTRVTLVTFASRHYALAPIPSRGWVAVLIVRAAQASAGLTLTHLSSLEKAVETWG